MRGKELNNKIIKEIFLNQNQREDHKDDQAEPA